MGRIHYFLALKTTGFFTSFFIYENRIYILIKLEMMFLLIRLGQATNITNAAGGGLLQNLVR